MSEEEFNKLSLDKKWAHIKNVMDYIISMDQAYNIQQRMHPHGTPDSTEQKRNMRVDQYQRWSHIKTLYAVNRDEMVDTMGNQEWAKCKNILERIFTMELDDALRVVIEN